MSAVVISPGFELKEKVAALAELILSKHPTMPGLLRQIHSTLLQYPEQVTLLEEPEIAVIVSGLQIQTNTTFAATVTKAKGATLTAKLKKLTADDL